MIALDLRHVLLDDHPILAFETRAAGREAARERGYALEHLRLAVTQCHRVWILGQWVDYPTRIRVATDEGSVVLPLPTPPYRSVETLARGAACPAHERTRR